WALAHEHADQLPGKYGAILFTFVHVEKPGLAVRDWAWLTRDPAKVVSVDKMTPVLSEPTRITVNLNQSRDADGGPWTTIRIKHEHLPIEWLDDMAIYWDYQLAIAQHHEFGLPKR